MASNSSPNIERSLADPCGAQIPPSTWVRGVGRSEVVRIALRTPPPGHRTARLTKSGRGHSFKFACKLQYLQATPHGRYPLNRGCPVEVVPDLADHHLLDWSTALEAFGLVIAEIERLANRKYPFGLEENGEILIGGTDLLRYGFSGLDKSEAIKSSANWPTAAE